MAETTLRDALTTAFEEQANVIDENPVQQVSSEVLDAPQETSEQRAERLRDEGGRFKAGEATDVQVKTKVPALEAPKVADPLAVVDEVKPPSSWRKDQWESFQKLDPITKKYIVERESQMASGVSTYRQEAEKAKELFEAIAPFQQDLNAHGVSSAKWIQQLGTAHQTLVKGSPDQKLAAFHKLAQDYRVPLDALLDPNVRQQFLTSQPAPPPQDVGKLVEEQFVKREAHTEIQRFAADPTNVHYEAVKGTMGQLLATGLADDLKSAYDKAVRMDSELWQSEQLRTSEAAEKQRKDAEAARVAKARANNVSVRSATPTGPGNAGGKKDLRSTIADAVEEQLGGARV